MKSPKCFLLAVVAGFWLALPVAFAQDAQTPPNPLGPAARPNPLTGLAAGAAAPQAAVTPSAQNERSHGMPSPDYTSMLFVFMLATFIGIGVIQRVSRLLHTPLMSLTNAISAIAVVGAILVTGPKHPWYITMLGAIALFASMTNIVSGYLITYRMLKMFKKQEPNKP